MCSSSFVWAPIYKKERHQITDVLSILYGRVVHLVRVCCPFRMGVLSILHGCLSNFFRPIFLKYFICIINFNYWLSCKSIMRLIASRIQLNHVLFPLDNSATLFIAILVILKYQNVFLYNTSPIYRKTFYNSEIWLSKWWLWIKALLSIWSQTCHKCHLYIRGICF